MDLLKSIDLRNLDFSKLSVIFTIIILIIVYIIIIFALKIMNKDMKHSQRKRIVRRSFGLEVVEAGKNSNIENGSVIPLRRGISIGRHEDNVLILNDSYVSSHHAQIVLRNNQYILEDLNSTNGTFLNSEKVTGKAYLKRGDSIKIGTSTFKVIG